MSRISHLFEKIVEHHPNQCAVSLNSDQITYEILNKRSNQLARYLIHTGIKPGQYIPIIADKTIETMIAIIAILKAGAVYVPINPEMPEKTILAILSDIQSTLIVTQSKYNSLRTEKIIRVHLEHLITLSAQFSELNLTELKSTHDVAYIIYTSGTTGKPKGVIVSHQNLIATFQSWKKIYGLTPADRHLQMAHFAFDVFTGDWVRALCSGGSLILCTKETLLNPAGLYSLIKAQKINFAEFVPATLNRLLSYVEKEQVSLSMFRLLICGSDQWTMKEYRRTQKGCGLETCVINSYGLTEGTIDSTYFNGIEDMASLPDNMLVPIGKPFPHVKLFILDKNKKPVRDQNVGEIYIGGAGVAKGYFALPDMNEERFIWIETPVGRERVYKTGDEAYFFKDGQVVFLGRHETQVKINGQRVELPAIEALLNEHPKVKQAVVVAAENNGTRHINSFLVLNDPSISQLELINYLKQSLPCYSIPKHFYAIQEVSLTPSGKIDRRAISQQRLQEIKPILSKPRNELEIKIAKVWAKILKVDFSEIGREPSFSEQGGSSLEYVTMLETLNQEFSIQLPLNIHAETIPSLASHIISFQQPRKHQIAIIGGGPAGVSMLIQLLAQLKHAPFSREIEISVFEKSNKIGLGLPYSQKEDCYILNLPKAVMEPIAGQTGIFAEWLKNNSNCPLDTDFPPRFYFGQYLNFLAENLREKNDLSGIRIKYYTKCEVSDIQKKTESDYLIKTSQGNYRSQYVILCTGHMPTSTYRNLIGTPGYQHNPWDSKSYNDIKSHDHVGIIGTRLTAIDTALKLFSNGHQGPVTMISRTGLLPTVLSPTVPPYYLKYLTLSNFVNLTSSGLLPLPLNSLLELFWKEISEAEKKPLSWENIIKSEKEISALQWLNREISQAEKGSKPWQQVLFAVYPILSNIWTYLSFADRKAFLEKYYSVFMTYLAAFPLNNAYKLRPYLQSGQLQVLGALKDVKGYDWRFELIREDGSIIIPQHLFNATGPGYNPLLIPLYASMSRNHLIQKHHLGGIEVDPQTLQVKDSSTLFAVGELTRGACLATTDMGRVNFHAQRIGLQVSQAIKLKHRSKIELPKIVKRSENYPSFFQRTMIPRSAPMALLKAGMRHFKI